MHTPRQFARWVLKPWLLFWNNMSNHFDALNTALSISVYVENEMEQ
jgi:hypothetical protein